MAILGIDEVGRGPWAGPLVVGACVLREPIEGLTDSKKLSARRREELNVVILEKAAYGLGWVSAGELDEIGVAAALKKAAIAAVRQVRESYTEIIIDGTVNLLAGTSRERHVTMLAKADLLIPAVSAASIVAKVARDRYMAEEAAVRYPEYGFERHVGYGTKAHFEALQEFGVCAEHRRSFAPVAQLVDDSSSGEAVEEGRATPLFRAERVGRDPVKTGVSPKVSSPELLSPTTHAIGKKAEGVVAEYLVGEGHEVLAQNWRTKMCEIDVISVREGKIYFTEVKYRQDSGHGNGLEVVTTEKLRQMKFAAECYMKHFRVKLAPLLAVASVEGVDFTVRDFLVLR